MTSNETVVSHPSFIRKWASLIVMSLALAIIIIDTTLLNVSLGSIIRDLNTDIISIQWVITAYSLTLAALTVTGGRIGDLFGRKRMFMLGAAIFAIGSLIASFSHSVGMLLLGESIIEGIGAALMMPATASLLVANFQGRDRAIAFGVWGGIAAAASAVGPILGGFLTSHYSWRWGFRINVVVTILLLLGSFLVKDLHLTKKKTSLDWGGVLLSSLGLLSIVFGFIESSSYGWFREKQPFSISGFQFELGGISIVPYALVMGIVLLVLFVLWELRKESRGQMPLVSMKIFVNRQFTSGIITTGIMSLGQSGIIFTIPVFLQSVRGLDAFNTGIALLPLSLTLLIASPLSAILSKKILPKHIIQFGLLLNFFAVILLRQAFSVDATSSSFIPGFLLYGMGMGLIMGQINNLTLSAVPVQDAGEASGVNNTIRQVGASMGSAIIGAVLLATIGTSVLGGIEANHHLPKIFKPYLEKTYAEQTSNIEFESGPNMKLKLPPSLLADLHGITQEAIVDGNKAAMSYAIFFVLLGLIASFQLPNTRMLSRPQASQIPKPSPLAEPSATA